MRKLLLTVAAFVLGVGILYFLCVWIPFLYPFWNARRVALTKTSALVAEAKLLLDERQKKGTESWTISEGTLPPAISSLGSDMAVSRIRLGKAIDVRLTGGFYHTGLYIITDTTSFTLPLDYKTAKINDHLYEYRRGG